MLKETEETIDLKHGDDQSGTQPVTIRTTPKGRQISIQDKLLFDKDGYKLRPAGYAFLKDLCSIIRNESYPVEITGHTDSRPPQEKGVESNQALSSLRALEVLRYFVVVGGIDPMRLSAYGCGP